MPGLVIHVKLSCRELYTKVAFHNLLILIISLFQFYGLQVDIEFSKMTDGKEDMFIKKWQGTIIPKLKEIASFEKKNLTSDTCWRKLTISRMVRFSSFISVACAHISKCGVCENDVYILTFNSRFKGNHFK